jgi:hypothetical protein
MKLMRASFFVCIAKSMNCPSVKLPAHKTWLLGTRLVKDVDEEQ